MTWGVYIDEKYECWIRPYPSLWAAIKAYRQLKGSVCRYRPSVSLVLTVAKHWENDDY
jgi:hypothetical protein